MDDVDWSGFEFGFEGRRNGRKLILQGPSLEAIRWGNFSDFENSHVDKNYGLENAKILGKKVIRGSARILDKIYIET